MTDPDAILAVTALAADTGPARHPVRIVADVHLSLRRGEALGVTGESGAGKSAALLAALGRLGSGVRVSGSVRLAGREILGLKPAAVTALPLALVPQEPETALDPAEPLGRQLVRVLRRVRRVARAEAVRRACDLMAAVGLPEPEAQMTAHPGALSGGLIQRAAIALALAADPDVLVADEPFSALDVRARREIFDLFARLRRERGLALVLVADDLGLLDAATDRLAVVYAGRTVETLSAGAPARHPFTAALRVAGPAAPVPGTPPLPGHPPPGCPFHPRCPRASDLCRVEVPRFDSGLACHHPLDGTA